VSLSPGARIGVYEVTTLLGVGGMGEVYRAHDGKLNRDVAVKVLPELLASDPDRLARFHREAQLLASLNHPHIAAIYGFEEFNSANALVMELVEGPTLAEIIDGSGLKAQASRALPLADALNVARQIGEALEAAHEQGIVHRDLKPSNVKVRDDGTVKVLDFGLAKLVEPAAAAQSINVTASPTITSPAMTHAGVILGTAAYMSPEQAKGRQADKRSDIWAFGCVLFEMLTGTRAFGGADVSDTFASILAREPDWRALPADLPPPVRVLLRRCLEKDRRKRLGDIAAALVLIDEAPSLTRETAAPQVRARSPKSMALFTAGAFGLGMAVAAGVAVGLAPRSVSDRTPVRRFRETMPAGVTLPAGGGPLIASSPDGQRVVYRASAGGKVRLYVWTLGELEPREIPGTDGARTPVVSPDGAWVAFMSGSTLMKVMLSGGRPVKVADVPAAAGASWGADGSILLGGGTYGVLQVSASGGTPVALIKPEDGRSYISPQALPGGRAILFTATPIAPDGDLLVFDLSSKTQRTILRHALGAHYVSSGHLVFVRGNDLWAVRFDPARAELIGEPVLVEQDIRLEIGGTAQTALSGGETLAYISAGGTIGGMTPRQLVWVDRDGREEPIAAPPTGYLVPRLSPDGTRAVLDAFNPDEHIWIWDFGRQTLTRLTSGAGVDRQPVWSRDGRRVVFASTRAGAFNLYSQAADGTGAVERLTNSPNQELAIGFSSDDRLAFIEYVNPPELRLMSLADRTVKKVLAAGVSNDMVLSRDGRWLAYPLNVSGRAEVDVRPFPSVDDGQWVVSNVGGAPLWSADGQELFYWNSQMLMQVAIGADPRTAAAPRRLFGGEYVTGVFQRAFDISPDGRRFLMMKNVQNADAPRDSIVVVENFAEELKRLLPAK